MGKPRPGRRPVTQADYEQVRQLHAIGRGAGDDPTTVLSRAEIARRMGRSGRTVSRIAAELGLTFERGWRTRAATEARKIDGRARRTALAVALLEDAERLRGQLFAECLVYNFGGKENTYNEHRLAEPSFRDKRDLMHAVGIAVDRAVRLDEYDSGSSLTGVVSLLDQLGRGLRDRYGTGDDEHPVDTGKDVAPE